MYVESALQELGWSLPSHATLLVKPCSHPRFGDFQTNAAFLLAGELRQSPVSVAETIARTIGSTELFEEPTVTGGGFINFRLRKAWCQSWLTRIQGDPRLGIGWVERPETVVIDFSSPNIAKEMHVGHLRSTILGDCLARLRRFLGHRVITDNHLGDWGTQFGMVILGFKKAGDWNALRERPLEHLEQLYRKIYEATRTDPAVWEEAKGELRRLQTGDPENVRLWEEFCRYSLQELSRLYERLGVVFDYQMGESAYRHMLPEVVSLLVEKGLARRSQGALCVFFDEDPELKEHPFVIQKSDGAYLYSTTDIATLLYRVEKWQAQRILYVTDARQKLHFRQLFAVARALKLPVQLEHITFGTILGEDRRPLRTREGPSLKLRELLDEAEARALQLVSEKRPDLPLEKRKEIAQTVGIGALKYADLSQNRELDYIFRWEKLLALDGNTAPYLLNAYVRICSILAKSGTVSESPIELPQPEEWELAKALLGLGETMRASMEESRPHFLCNHLYELARAFHRFYESCPVLQADTETRRLSRLGLCRIAAQSLKIGLECLGIKPLEEM